MNNKTTAEEILRQLGGGRFKVMTGAKNFGYSEDSVNPYLSFQLPSRFATKGINFVKITLNCMDTYDIAFSKIWGHKLKEIDKAAGIYCDMLQSTFTRVTGLDTHL